jgi:hypothetical protein
VAHLIRQIQTRAVAALGHSEAEDLVGATLRHVHDRVIDIFGPEAWEEAAGS